MCGEVAALVLNAIPGVGPRVFHRIYAALGDRFSEILGRPAEELEREFSLAPAAAAAIARWEESIDVADELGKLERLGGRFIPWFSADYPAALRGVRDAPIGLYAIGKDFGRRCVAIVGSRRCTFYGEKIALSLAGSLAERGYSVVSGLARGIDMAAHGGALAAGGHTAAVLAGAIDQIYPTENSDLYHRIGREGILFSEFPFGKTIDRQCFAVRNRIITGIAAATIVVESPESGGSMLSAHFARRQGRPLFAVPGRINDSCSDGCHRLIQDGARLFTRVEDVLAVIEGGPVPQQLPLAMPAGEPSFSECADGADEKMWRVLSAAGGATAEELAPRMGMEIAACASSLQDLCIRGMVRREIGGKFVPPLRRAA